MGDRRRRLSTHLSAQPLELPDWPPSRLIKWCLIKNRGPAGVMCYDFWASLAKR